MLSCFSLVSQQVFILFALMGVGFAANRLRILDERSVRGMVDLLVDVVTPCLIVHVFQRPFDHGLLTALGIAFAVALSAHGLGALLSHTLVGRDPSRRCVARYAVIFSNAGFMGLPLEYAILGERGVFYGAVYVAVFNLLSWSYGLAVMCGSMRDLRYRTLFVNPGTIGVIVGLTFFLTSFALPTCLAQPVKLLSDLNTPLAMIVIGWYLANARFRPVLTSSMAWNVAALRLLAIPALVLAALLGIARLVPTLDRAMLCAIVTASSAPAAALTTIIASRYARDVAFSVGLVAGTTLLSALTMPLIVGLALLVF